MRQSSPVSQARRWFEEVGFVGEAGQRMRAQIPSEKMVDAKVRASFDVQGCMTEGVGEKSAESRGKGDGRCTRAGLTLLSKSA